MQINWKHIWTLNGSQTEGFEEFASQLAWREAMPQGNSAIGRELVQRQQGRAFFGEKFGDGAIIRPGPLVAWRHCYEAGRYRPIMRFAILARE